MASRVKTTASKAKPMNQERRRFKSFSLQSCTADLAAFHQHPSWCITPSVMADHVAPLTVAPMVAAYAAPAIASGRAIAVSIAARIASDSPKTSIVKHTARLNSLCRPAIAIALTFAAMVDVGILTGKL